MEKKKTTKRKKIIIIGVVVLIAIAGYFYFGGKKIVQTSTISVERGDVVEEVSITGKVVPARSIDLAFEKSGRLSRFYATIGKKVNRGDILAQLENGDLLAQISQAEATLKTQQAKLDEINKGSRPEEIAIRKTELKKAEQDLENYYRGLRDVLNDAYAKADDAVRAKTDDLFTDDDTPNPKLTFNVSNAQAAIDVASMRYQTGNELSAWRKELQEINENSSPESLSNILRLGEEHLSFIRTFLTRTLDALDGAAGISATTIATYKASIFSGRTNVNIAYTALSSQQQLIASQKIAVERIKNELSLTLAGATDEQITAQEAQVDQANANISYYRTQYEKTLLRAPFSGIVTKTNKEVGNIVALNESIVSLIGAGNFEIEANVAESDIAKIKIGDAARVTLDAYGKGVIFEAKITQIDLSETVLEGVATYKTKLQFNESDERIIPGLTADVDILSGKKEGVIYIPTRNIIIDQGKYFVEKVNGESSEKIEVTIGLKGSDGRTEILSGLVEGDVISAE